MSEKFQVPRTHCGYPLWHLLCEEFHYWKPIAQKKNALPYEDIKQWAQEKKECSREKVFMITVTLDASRMIKAEDREGLQSPSFNFSGLSVQSITPE